MAKCLWHKTFCLCLSWGLLGLFYFAEKISLLKSLQIAYGPVGGYLVLTDVFHPYWKAAVDGSEAEIIPAFHAFRAVKVPPGTHKVEFFCRVSYFRTAFLVSLVSAGILSVFTFYFWNGTMRNWA